MYRIFFFPNNLQLLFHFFACNSKKYVTNTGTSDEEVFAAAYHKLVHSPAVETILQVENSYAGAVASAQKNRDEDIYKLTKRYILA